jgi:hypothetical protein
MVWFQLLREVPAVTLMLMEAQPDSIIQGV